MDKREELKESMKALEVMDLISKKISSVKDLDKQIKQLSELRADKKGDRSKMIKSMDKVQEQLVVIDVIDKLLLDKEF